MKKQNFIKALREAQQHTNTASRTITSALIVANIDKPDTPPTLQALIDRLISTSEDLDELIAACEADAGRWARINWD